MSEIESDLSIEKAQKLVELSSDTRVLEIVGDVPDGSAALQLDHLIGVLQSMKSVNASSGEDELKRQ